MKVLGTLALLLAAASAAPAQSLLGDSGASPYDPPRRPAYQKHDHLQILVPERSRASSAPELKIDRCSRREMDLDKWARFDRAKDARKPSGADLAGDPGVDLCSMIGAEVVDVRPNGVLVVQAIKRRRVNEDAELIRLTGEVAPEAVTLNVVHADRIVNLSVTYERSKAANGAAGPGIRGRALK